MSRVFVVVSFLIACLITLAGWTWWISHDRPLPETRPHTVMWDVVSLALRTEGIQVAGGELPVENNPLVMASAWLLKTFGWRFSAMTAVQIPFLFLLLASVCALAWRLGGAFAGALAPWLAALAPTSVGLAVYVNDLLPIQALVAAALALLAWSDRENRGWPAMFAFLPIAFAAWISLLPSNAILQLLVFLVAATALLSKHAWQVGLRLYRKLPVTCAAWLPLVWGGGSMLLAVVLSILLMPETTASYFTGEAQNSAFATVWEQPAGLMAYPLAWSGYQIGPALALAVIASVCVLAWYKKPASVLVPVVWLLVPILALSLVAKRNDYYLIAAVPATFVLIAVALSPIRRRWLQWLLAVALLAAAGWQWGDMVADPDWEPLLPPILVGMQDPVRPYLISPFAPLRDKEAMAQKMAEICVPRGLRLFRIKSTLSLKVIDFHAWHADHRLLPGDLFNGPALPEEGACLLVNFPTNQPPSENLRDVLVWFNEAMIASRDVRPEVERRVAKLMAVADRYERVWVSGYMALFVPR